MRSGDAAGSCCGQLVTSDELIVNETRVPHPLKSDAETAECCDSALLSTCCERGGQAGHAAGRNRSPDGLRVRRARLTAIESR